MRSTTLAVLLTIVGTNAFAAVPRLVMPSDSGGDAITLAAVDVRVTIRGHLARTEYDLTFRSALPNAAGGDFVFPIPPDGEVSDLGLYFNGKLRHAVAAERVLAQKAYDQTVHRNVDPALADWTDSRAFRMRLYPIPALGTKQVRIACDQELLSNEYLLDLGFKQVVDYSIAVDADGREVTATGIALRPDGTTWSAHAHQAKLDAKISVPRSDARDALIAWSEHDRTWYVSAPFSAPPSGPAWPAAAHVTLIWDASGSATQQDAARLRAFFDAFFVRQLAWTSVTVVPFDVDVRPARQTTPRDLARTLDTIDVAGATNLTAALRSIRDIALNVPQTRIVIGTDGTNGMGDSDALRAAANAVRVPLTIVNAAPRANEPFLSGLAATTGGVYLDLTRTTADMTSERAMHRRATTTIAAPELIDLAPAAVAFDGSTFAFGGRAAERPPVVTIRGRELPVRDVSDAADLVRRAWARAHLRELIERGAAAADVASLGREQTMLTPQTSLIVLESKRDYEMYGFPVPEDLANEPEPRAPVPPSPAPQITPLQIIGKAAWFAKGSVTEKSGGALPGVTVSITSNVGANSTVTDANGLYWLPLPAAPASATVRAELAGYGSVTRGIANPPSGGTVDLMLNPSVSESITVTAAAPYLDPGGSDNSVVASHASLRAHPRAPLDDVLTRVANEYNAASLDARHALVESVIARMAAMRSADERFRYYAAARDVIGGDKTFHLRAAELFRRDDAERALRILTDLAESEIDDASVVRLIARIADGWGFPDVARGLLEHALESAPEHPQTWRELMLLAAQRRPAELAVLAKRQKAIAQSWRMTESNEQIAMELARGGGDPRRDPRARVQAELMWEGDYGYVDIHVVEPSGVEVTWDHDASAAGGLLTGWGNWGYGPEIYTNPGSASGAYRIDVQYYSDDDTNASHETMCHLIVYREGVRSDYAIVLSRPDERRTVTTVRLP